MSTKIMYDKYVILFIAYVLVWFLNTALIRQYNIDDFELNI